jgi:hypothetical protein
MTTPNYVPPGSTYAIPIQLGVAVGIGPIIADTLAGSLDALLTVTLSAEYQRNPPPEYPRPDPGVVPSPFLGPHTFTSGTQVTVRRDEAHALVAAGAATLS